MKELKFRDLRADEIECRVGTINARGLTLLLYKDARCDMKLLDETVGPMNWQRRHYEHKGNIYCGIAIKDTDTDEWVEKEDCGAETYTEKEKGEASDSFKRAGTNWGIGRELYTSPFIWLDAKTGGVESDDKGKYKTKERFTVTDIGIKDKKIIRLVIKNAKNTVVYGYGVAPDNNGDPAPTTDELITAEQKKNIKALLKLYATKTQTTAADVNNAIEAQFGKAVNEMTAAEGVEVYRFLGARIKEFDETQNNNKI